MSLLPIKDDEIRIISPGINKPADDVDIDTNISLDKDEHVPSIAKHNAPKKRRKHIIIAAIIVGLLCILTVLCLHISRRNEYKTLQVVVNEAPSSQKNIGEDEFMEAAQAAAEQGFVTITDTVVNGEQLMIFKPANLTPTLQIGGEVLSDSTAAFVVQAAGVRDDNGGIVGAFVAKGELLSKGEAKSGYCAIIGGKMSIGVADATPLLEQALESDGYFFRQYPLVVAKQMVENKPKQESLRKALADLNGEPVVIMSRERMTFHDFSQTLVDLGVTNAIYLIGSTSYGFAIDPQKRKVEFGRREKTIPQNTSYIVWR